MDHIVFIGGVGSNRSQLEEVVDELEKQFSHVTAFSFREAQQFPDRLQRTTANALIITHSAGMTLIDDLHPKQVVAIAPPVPRRSLELLAGTIVKTRDLLKTGRLERERKNKLRAYHWRALKEHVSHPRLNSLKIRDIGGFSAIESAILLVNRGVRVTIGTMDNDRLFHVLSYNEVVRLRESGVEVYVSLPGEHDEVLIDPMRVLSKLHLF